MRGGGEYRLFRWLALRGGYSQSKEERTIGISEGDFNTSAASVGAGWYLKDDRLSLDAAFVSKVTKPELDVGDERQTRHQTLMVYGRLLF